MLRVVRANGCLILWVLLNVVIFIVTYHKYLRPQHYYLQIMLGRGLCVSRAAAAIINLNSALVLLPVCRGLNSLLYRGLGKLSRSLLTLWLSRLRHVHITLAITIIVASVVHSAAHLVNSVNFSYHFNNRHKEINWAKFKGQSPLLLVLTSTVGVTGIAMIIILFLMLLLSLKCVRERHYDLFWATHFLFLPFMGLLVLHPLSGVLKELSNYPLHIPSCANTTSISNISENRLYEDACFTKPIFVPMECQGWLWVVASMVVFSADFLLRLCRRNQTSYQVCRVVTLPAGVTQITLTSRKSFLFKPGQYILLQCPRLSTLEWHPFTVTSICSSSSQTRITVLIRRRGDWTKAVCRLLQNFGSDQITLQSRVPIRLLVDGPFCSPMENILKSQIVVCIAAGIGITPFIAALEYLYQRECVRWMRPSRLHLVWIVRSPQQLTWATDLITKLHHKMWYANQPDRFEVSFYITKNFKNEKAQFDALSLSLLETRSHFGRPIWTDLFQEWASLYHKKCVSVFTCGPPALHKQVKCTASKFNGRGSQFTCVHEAFS